MPLTKQQVADARKVYDLFWDSYIKGDVDTFASTLDDKFEMVGTSESERCHTKVEGIEFFKGQVEELVGKAEMRNRQIHAMPLEGMVLINELCDIYVLVETNWNFYSIIRISTFLRETPDGWKVVQQHGSLPDNRVQEGETLAIDKISRENFELRDAVKRRTAELESKNRELEIEAAVERVRAEAMAMQSTNDFEKVTRQLLAQIKNLNLDGFTGASICLIDENQFMSWWDFSSPGNVADPESQTLRYDAHKYKILGLDVLKKWQTGELYMEFDYDLESLHAAVKEWESINADIAKAFKEALLKGKLTHQWNPCGRISNGFLAFDMIRPPDDDVRKITIKMAHAFDQAYTRFLDLKKAEAQAIEAKIEAALEKVRSRSLAMHKSDEVNEVVSVLFEKLKDLQIPFTAVGIATRIEGSKDLNGFVCGQNDSGLVITNYRIPYFDNPIPKDLYSTLEKQLDFYVGHYSKEEKDAFYEYVLEHTAEFRDLPEDIKHMIFESPVCTITHVAVKNAVFNINDFEGKVLAENEIDIIKRFARVFDQAYTRFLDLQNAEAQTREMLIEAALERTRAQSMMMQHSGEINSISNAFHEQLVLLGIPSEFSYVWLPDEDNQTHQFWASWYEVNAGKSSLKSKQITYPLDKSEPYTAACFEAWATPDVILEEFIPPQDIAGFFDVWQKLLSGAKKLKPEYFPEGIYYSEAYMRYGCFGINIRRKLSEEEKSILKRFSKEFERAYTRFLDLQTAEKQALVIREERDRLEIALKELHATQDQLVQQEKLASLGQLTAGIAHEIKNPLNFVNNFSEVSLELVEEVLEEVKTHGHASQGHASQGHASHGHASDDHASQQTITEILTDIKSNLTKIHEHGSRADNIVKSMLQHSRGGAGKMEPTDLNALIKEYVNLSFHGMRAGKNPINVDIQLDLDDSMGKVNLIGEDFSRVILNLCNNAFDALKSAKTRRHASLNVRTKKRDNSIAIEIEDNGPGIPDEIKDKILQPFFTTKKGTQGTGLGLSITNDIVKAHGGELTVTSQTGTGTTIMIKLPKMD